MTEAEEKVVTKTLIFSGDYEYERAAAVVVAKHFWCDFRLLDAEDHEGEEETPLWGPERCPDLLSASGPVANGHIKWDGCLQLNVNVHLCDNVKDLQRLYGWLQQTLKLAHAAMVEAGGDPEWEPLP